MSKKVENEMQYFFDMRNLEVSPTFVYYAGKSRETGKRSYNKLQMNKDFLDDIFNKFEGSYIRVFEEFSEKGCEELQLFIKGSNIFIKIFMSKTKGAKSNKSKEMNNKNDEEDRLIYGINIDYDLNKDNEEELNYIDSLVKKYNDPNKKRFFTVVDIGGILELRDINVYPYDIDLDLHYNDGFREEFHTPFTEGCEAFGSGLSILKGDPGTGKTNYIKNILKYINKDIIYLPPNMANLIAEPKMVDFLMENTKKLVIIEDAENILKKREEGSNSAVSNILNVTDGIIGDEMEFDILCTLNDRCDIDDALLRSGRLKADFELKELELNKCKEIAKNIGVDEEEITEEMTISDLYNYSENKSNLLENGKATKIGYSNG